MLSRLMFKKPSMLVFLLIGGVLLQSILWLYTGLYYNRASDLIPLHYTIYFGIDLIDYKTKLFFYPLWGLILLAVNSSLAFIIKKERLIGYFLLIIAVCAQLLILATEVALIRHFY